MILFKETVQNQNGQVMAAVQVTVFLTGTNTKAALFSDDGVTPLGNPVTTDSLGRFQFYINSGRYDLQVTGGAFAITSVTNIEITDILEFQTGDASPWTAPVLNLQNQPSGVRPPSNTVNLYSKTADKNLYYQDDAGREIGPLSVGGSNILSLNNTFTGTNNFTADTLFKGPNPYRDFRNYGGYSSNSPAPSTTGSITAGQTTLTLANAQDFANAQGIVVHKAGANPTVSTPGLATVTPINLGGGSTTYNYRTVAEDKNGGLSAASAVATTNLGAATLGSNFVALSTCVRVSGLATYTAGATHNLAAGTQINIGGFSGICSGVKTIATVPTGTTFTTKDGVGAPDESISGAGSAQVYACNKLDFPPGTYSGNSTVRYWIYRNNALVGVAQGIDPFFIDCALAAPNAPLYVPSAPPATTQPGYLATTIVAGGGTTTLTLASAAGSTVSSQTVLHDNSLALVACVQAVLSNSGGTCYIPNTSTFGKWVFNATTDLSSLGGGPARIHLAGDVLLNQTWVLKNSLEIEGEARQNASFMYIPGSDIGGNAYPLLLIQYPLATNSIHLKALRVSAFQPQQTGLLTDEGPDTGGFVGLIADDCAFIGQNGNGNPVVIKSGFDYYFNRGTITSGGASFSPTVALLNTIASPAVVGFQNVIIAGRIHLDQVNFANNGIVFDCSPKTNQNYFGTNWSFSNILYESQRAPFFRMNCGAGGGMGDFNFKTITIADSVVGFGTPVIDSQNTVGMFASWDGGNSANGLTPLMIGGGGLFVRSGGPFISNIGNGGLSLGIGGASGTDGVTYGVAGTGRFYGATGTPGAPVSAVVSAGGNVPVGVGIGYGISCLDVSGVETLVGPLNQSATTTPGNQTVTVTPPLLPIGCVSYFVYRGSPGAIARANIAPISGGCGTGINPGVAFVDTSNFGCGQSPPTTSVAGRTVVDVNRVATTQLKLLDTNSNFLATTAFAAPLTASRTVNLPDASGTVAFKDLAQTWTASQTLQGNIFSTGVAFASLGTPANGALIYCSDCTIANPCAGGGTGALAKRLNSVWVCN